MCYRYPKSKYVAVFMITIGISMATIASAQQAVSLHGIMTWDYFIQIFQSNGASDEETQTVDPATGNIKEVYDLLSMMSG